MGCGTSVSKPSFLGLVLLSWWKSVCFLNKKMFLQVIVRRTNTIHNCFSLTGSVFTCLTVALGFYRLWI